MSRESRIVAELRAAGFTVLTRKQWGSRHRALYQTRRVTRRFVGPADHAFGHITVTRDTGDARADARMIEDIGYSRFRTGWSYNWGLHPSTHTIILGQPHDAAGAHTLNDKGIGGFRSNLNYWGHAIAKIGLPGDGFSDWERDAAAAIIAAEKKHGAMKPGAQLHPHSKFAWKDCPCAPYRNSIPAIERAARTILTPTRPRPEEDWFDMASLNDLRDLFREAGNLIQIPKPWAEDGDDSTVNLGWALAGTWRQAKKAEKAAAETKELLEELRARLDAEGK